jgi:hypothetical protein
MKEIAMSRTHRVTNRVRSHESTAFGSIVKKVRETGEEHQLLLASEQRGDVIVTIKPRG